MENLEPHLRYVPELRTTSILAPHPHGWQVDNCLVQGLMNILDCYFEEFRPFEGVVKKSPEAAEQLKGNIEPMFIFALVWSVLVTVDRKGREFMDQFLRWENMCHRCVS